MKTTANVSLFIVEDDELFRETFIDAMALRGVKVDGARCGAEAIKALQHQRPSAIIIDVQLPDIHGFDLCHVLKKSEQLKNVPIVFLSASTKYNDPRDQVEGLLAGAAAFLPKPITLEKLSGEIDGILRAPSA